MLRNKIPTSGMQFPLRNFGMFVRWGYYFFYSAYMHTSTLHLNRFINLLYLKTKLNLKSLTIFKCFESHRYH